jgi:hypothetical protein
MTNTQPDRIFTWIITLRNKCAIVTDTTETLYLALYHHRVSPPGLREGDCITGVVVPAREGPLQLLTAIDRVPQIAELQYLPSKVTATIFAAHERVSFARDAEGFDFFVPRGGFAVGSVITGRPEAAHRGAIPALIPEARDEQAA